MNINHGHKIIYYIKNRLSAVYKTFNLYGISSIIIITYILLLCVYINGCKDQKDDNVKQHTKSTDNSNIQAVWDKNNNIIIIQDFKLRHKELWPVVYWCWTEVNITNNHRIGELPKLGKIIYGQIYSYGALSVEVNNTNYRLDKSPHYYAEFKVIGNDDRGGVIEYIPNKLFISNNECKLIPKLQEASRFLEKPNWLHDLEPQYICFLNRPLIPKDEWVNMDTYEYGGSFENVCVTVIPIKKD